MKCQSVGTLRAMAMVIAVASCTVLWSNSDTACIAQVRSPRQAEVLPAPRVPTRIGHRDVIGIWQGRMLMRRFQAPANARLAKATLCIVASNRIKNPIVASIWSDSGGRPDFKHLLCSQSRDIAVTGGRISSGINLGNSGADKTLAGREITRAAFTLNCRLTRGRYYWLVVSPEYWWCGSIVPKNGKAIHGFDTQEGPEVGPTIFLAEKSGSAERQTRIAWWTPEGELAIGNVRDLSAAAGCGLALDLKLSE